MFENETVVKTNYFIVFGLFFYIFIERINWENYKSNVILMKSIFNLMKFIFYEMRESGMYVKCFMEKYKMFNSLFKYHKIRV